MSISTNCPNCKSLFRLPDELAGRTAKCQKCAQLFVVPTGQAGEVAPAESVRKEEEARANEPPAEKPTMMPPAPHPLPPVVKLVEAVEKHEEPPPPPPTRSRTEPRVERPAKSGSGSLAIVLAIVGLGVFLCVICSGAGVGFYILNPKAKAPPPKNIVIIRKDGPKFDGFKDKVVFDGPKDMFKKDDVFKDGFGKDGAFKFDMDEKQPLPVPPGIVVIPAAFEPNGVFHSNNALGVNDPVRRHNRRAKLFSILLEAGKAYQIDMTSVEFDAYLYLYDDLDILIARNDDGGGNLNARIFFTPVRTATYRIEVASFAGDSVGNFNLTVRKN